MTTAMFANSLSLEDNGDGTWNVGYVTDTAIAGFQFTVDGATVLDGSGGDADANGFMVSAGGSTVLGFSLTGSTIPAQDGGVLLVLDVNGSPTALSGIIVSSASGNDLGFTYDSGEGSGDDGGNDVEGCTDMGACNYDSDATVDDGSCEFAEENYDCDGNCTVGEDCNGDCGGDAVVDECGVCDGDGSSCGDDGGTVDGTSISFGLIDDGSIEILMSNDQPIAGFQFTLSGVEIDAASGGSAEDNGFMVSASGSTVIGFYLWSK